MDPDEQPLSGHSCTVGAALDLLEQGEPLEKMMLKEEMADGVDCHEIFTKLGSLN